MRLCLSMTNNLMQTTCFVLLEARRPRRLAALLSSHIPRPCKIQKAQRGSDAANTLEVGVFTQGHHHIFLVLPSSTEILVPHYLPRGASVFSAKKSTFLTEESCPLMFRADISTNALLHPRTSTDDKFYIVHLNTFKIQKRDKLKSTKQNLLNLQPLSKGYLQSTLIHYLFLPLSAKLNFFNKLPINSRQTVC